MNYGTPAYKPGDGLQDAATKKQKEIIASFKKALANLCTGEKIEELLRILELEWASGRRDFPNVWDTPLDFEEVYNDLNKYDRKYFVSEPNLYRYLRQLAEIKNNDIATEKAPVPSFELPAKRA